MIFSFRQRCVYLGLTRRDVTPRQESPLIALLLRGKAALEEILGKVVFSLLELKLMSHIRCGCVQAV